MRVQLLIDLDVESRVDDLVIREVARNVFFAAIAPGVFVDGVSIVADDGKTSRRLGPYAMPHEDEP